MRQFRMPEDLSEETKYAGKDPEYRNREVLQTDQGKEVVVVDYLKNLGLYVVSETEQDGIVSPMFRISPDRLKRAEKLKSE